MSLITATGLAKSYGALDVFQNLSVEIPHGARIALVGPNGAGKTTLLRILIGEESPTEGKISRKRGLTIGYLPQEMDFEASDRVLWDEMLDAFGDLLALERRIAEMEAKMAEPEQFEALSERYGEALERFELMGGYEYEARIRQVLTGLGFGEDDFRRPMSQLSGGQRTRALLARLLLARPMLLVLDEPTNHLDIEAMEWLERFLGGWEGAVLMVSHDRYFMDRVARTIWELDNGRLDVYRGNYSHYVRQREERRARQLAEYRARQEFIARQEEYIRRNIAGQNTRQAQGRRKRLERLMREKPIERPRERRTMRVEFGDVSRSGNEVLITEGLVIGYSADRPLMRLPDLVLRRGEVAALIGPNGIGKTTFLKTVLGQVPPLAGRVRIGAGVRIGYVAQEHSALNPTRSVLDSVLDVSDLTVSQARDFLAAYLFTGDDVFKSVGALSGGERSRLAIARLILTGANFLLLDEPTNHLDIPSQEAFQTVLADFPGTVLLVSHDRYLIDALATQIWEAASVMGDKPGAESAAELTVFDGPYREYLEWRRDVDKTGGGANFPADGKSDREKPPRRGGLSPYKLARRLEELEADIQELEMELARLTAGLERASVDGHPDRIAELGKRYAEIEAILEARLREWEELAG